MVPEKAKYVPSSLSPFFIGEFDLCEFIINTLIVILIFLLHSIFAAYVSHLHVLTTLSVVTQTLHELSLIIYLSVWLELVKWQTSKRYLYNWLWVHLMWDYL